MRLHLQARLLVLVPGLALTLLQTLAPQVRVLHLDLDPAPDQFLHLPLLPAVQVLAALVVSLLLSEKALLEYLSEAARRHHHQSLRKLLHLQGKYLLYLSHV